MYAVGGDDLRPKKKQRKKERPAWLKPAVCEDYRKGMTMEQVARKYHVSDRLVSQYIHEEGILGATPKTPKTTPASPAFHDLCELLIMAKVYLGRTPNESEITRIMKEVRHEQEETKVR